MSAFFEVPQLPAQGLDIYNRGDYSTSPGRERYRLPASFPEYKYIADLVPPFAVRPDTEAYRKRHLDLAPFSEAEQTFANKELYERLSSAYRAMDKEPAIFARPRRIYADLLKANTFYRQNQTLLKPLLAHFDPVGLKTSIPELRRDNQATKSLVDTLMALESEALAWPQDAPLEEQQRKDQIIQTIEGYDAGRYLVMADGCLDVLSARAMFWFDELATISTHPALREIDDDIHSTPIIWTEDQVVE